MFFYVILSNIYLFSHFLLDKNSKLPPSILKEKNVFKPESFGGEFSAHPFRDQFGRRRSVAQYKTNSLPRSFESKNIIEKSEHSKVDSRNLSTLDSWNITIHSVTKKSEAVANAGNYFDGMTRLRIENVQFGYSAQLYEQ